MMNLALKQNPLNQAFGQLASAGLEQALQETLEKGKQIKATKDKIAFLQHLGRKAVKKNSYPHINPKINGMEYGGWMEISMANRPAEWRLKRMKFFGDWCGEKNLDKILPDIVKDTKERVYQIDLRLFGIQNEEYEVDTLIVRNPKNMDELELKAKQYCAAFAFDEDLLLDLDQCYFEVRA